MTLDEKCKIYHDKGYNCCQSVLCALGEYTKLPEETAIKLGAGFGGGMQCGNVCGAVTGGLMAMGCACLGGQDAVEDKTTGANLTRELEGVFEAEFGTLLCSDIVGANGRTICDRCIEFAAKAAERIIQKQNG